MIIIGIVLLILALAAIGFVIYGSSGADSVSLEAFGLVVETSPLALFLAGAATLLIAVLGLLAMRGGARGSARRRSEIGRLRRVEAEAQARQAEDAKAREAEDAKAREAEDAKAREAEEARQAELAQRQAAEAERAAAATATSQHVTETTVLRREPVAADTPFGREAGADTSLTKPAAGTSSGSTASDAAGDSGSRPDSGTRDTGKDSSRL